jgi:subtilisin family serine protease
LRLFFYCDTDPTSNNLPSELTMAFPSLRHFTAPTFFTLLILLAASLIGSAGTIPTHSRLTAVNEGFPAVPDEYMVIFNEGHDMKQHLSFLGVAGNTSDCRFEPFPILHGYAGYYDQEMLAKVLADPGVKHVDPHTMGYIDSEMSSEPVDMTTLANSTAALAPKLAKRKTSAPPLVQGYYRNPAPWHLAMISDWTWKHSASDPDLMTFTLDGKATGEGARIYILDTGFDPQAAKYWFPVEAQYDYTGTGAADTNGHGTTVASLAASDPFGVAKNAKLINIKVCASSASVDDDLPRCSTKHIASALAEILAAEALARISGRIRSAPVIVMSFMIGPTKTITDLIHKSSDTFVYVAAAGNRGRDAARNYPCNVDGVFCAGAIGRTFKRWESRGGGSASGTKVFFVAPGDTLEVAWLHKQTFTGSGTSFAAPLVAGIAAVIRSYEPLLTSCELMQRMAQNAVCGQSTGWKRGSKCLVQTGYYEGDKGQPYLVRPFNSKWVCPNEVRM